MRIAGRRSNPTVLGHRKSGQFACHSGSVVDENGSILGADLRERLMAVLNLKQRRRALSRSYELTADLRLRTLGFHGDQGMRSRLELLKRQVEYQFLSHYFGSPPLWRLWLRRLGGKRVLPDFCVVGPMKSGTSDLAVSLLMHPNVLAPFAKEFFAAQPSQWPIFYPTQRQKERHERRHGLALCPYLVPTMHWMEVPYRLSRLQPQTKVVLALREPVARFYSQWKWEMFLSGKRRADELPFLSSFTAFVTHALSVYPESPSYTASGFQPLQTSIYWKSVQYWIDCFGRENVRVVDIDEYFSDANKFLGRMFDFVGLPPFKSDEAGAIVNENPLEYPPPDSESTWKLREFFQPHNEMLWNVIGERFSW